MYAGEVIESGPRDEVLESPQHPYTQALLATLRPSGRRMSHIAGQVPDLRQMIDECAFADRCPLAAPECRAGRPAEIRVDTAHAVRCVRARPTPLNHRPIKGAAC